MGCPAAVSRSGTLPDDEEVLHSLKSSVSTEAGSDHPALRQLSSRPRHDERIPGKGLFPSDA